MKKNIKNKRYWFIFAAVFIISFAIMTQIVSGEYFSPAQHRLVEIGGGLIVALLLTPYLMRW